MGKIVDITQFPKAIEKIAYASESPEQILDIYYPSSTAGPWPLVIFIHGGGWRSGGRREDVISTVFKAVSQGYAMATIDYRLVPNGIWPAQIYDIKAAIRYLKANSDKLDLKTDRLVVWGNSAGGHLAQMLTAISKRKQFEKNQIENEYISCNVDGLISWYGVSDFAALNEDTKALKIQRLHHPLKEGAAAELLRGDNYADTLAHAIEASPINYIGEDFPVCLIQHGTNDTAVPYLQSVHLYERICQCCGSGRATLELFEGAVHGDPLIKSDENINRCIDFLDEIYFKDSERPKARTPLPEIQLIEDESHTNDLFEK